jgi:hypothetical protein
MLNIVEASVQVIAGTFLIFCTNLIVFPVLGIEATVVSNLYLVLINTLVAFIKSFYVRQFFKRMEKHDN